MILATCIQQRAKYLSVPSTTSSKSSSSSSSSHHPVKSIRSIGTYYSVAIILLFTQAGIFGTNSALDPSTIARSAARSMPPKDGFRTVLSSSSTVNNDNHDDDLHQIYDSSHLSLIEDDTAMNDIELRPLIHSSSSSSSLLNNNTPQRQPRKGRHSRNNRNNNAEKSPNKVRYGLFRRKLMEDSSDWNGSTMMNGVNNSTIHPQHQPYVTTTAAATTAATTTTTTSKMTSYIYNTIFFRGGATPISTTSDELIHGNGSSTSNSNYGISTSSSITIASTKFIQTIFVNNFLKFANFIGYSKPRCFILLFISVLIESYATTLSKQAKDTGNASLFARACVAYIICMIGFNISLAKIDVSVAYAVWSAFGTTVVTAVGFFAFGESLDMSKILYLGMIVCGVVGLNLRDLGEH